MRTITALLLTFTLFGLFGCARQGPIDSEEGQRLLEEALDGIPNVEKVSDVHYAMQGPFKHDVATMSGVLASNTDDRATNQEILDEACRRILTTMQDNPVKKSSVRIRLVDASGHTMRLEEIGLPYVPSLEDLAEHYGIPRHG